MAARMSPIKTCGVLAVVSLAISSAPAALAADAGTGGSGAPSPTGNSAVGLHAIVVGGGELPLVDGSSTAARALIAASLGGEDQVAFTALTDDGSGIWRTLKTGETELVLLEGTEIPGLDGMNINGSSTPLLDASGRLGTAALVGEPFLLGTTALVYEGADGFSLVAQQGDEAPGTGEPAATFGTIWLTHQPAPGVMAFLSDLGGEDVDDRSRYGLWSWRDGTLSKLMRCGDPAPGIELQFIDCSAQPRLVSMNAEGEALLSARYTGAVETNTTELWGLWRGHSADDLELVLRYDTELPNGEVLAFGSYDDAYLGDTGQMYVQSSVAVREVDRYEGLWGGPPDALQPILRAGYSAPGLAAGEIVQTLAADVPPAYSANGWFLIAGTLVGSTHVVWLGSPDGLKLLVRTGDVMPGSDEAVLMPTSLSVNEHGQGIVEFANEAGGTALYRFTPGRDPELIVASSGCVVDVDGEPNAINSYTHSCTRMRAPSPLHSGCLNAAGQVLFSAQLADERRGFILSEGREVDAEVSFDSEPNAEGESIGDAGIDATDTEPALDGSVATSDVDESELGDPSDAGASIGKPEEEPGTVGPEEQDSGTTSDELPSDAAADHPDPSTSHADASPAHATSPATDDDDSCACRIGKPTRRPAFHAASFVLLGGLGLLRRRSTRR